MAEVDGLRFDAWSETARKVVSWEARVEELPATSSVMVGIDEDGEKIVEFVHQEVPGTEIVLRYGDEELRFSPSHDEEELRLVLADYNAERSSVAAHASGDHADVPSGRCPECIAEHFAAVAAQRRRASLYHFETPTSGRA